MNTGQFLARLDGVKRAQDGQWYARCPAHEDHRQSLSVARGDDGRTLITCHAGCRTDDVLQRLGLAERDLFDDAGQQRPSERQVVATYDYRDERGQLLFQVVRKEDKSFSQRRPAGTGGWVWKLGDVRRVLYRLPELLAAPAEQPVFVVEGEKDVDNLRAIGIVATCNPHGAGKWAVVSDLARRVLRGREVVVIPDNDDPGRAHAAAISGSLQGAARSVRLLELPGLPPAGDVSDWLKAGGSAAALVELARAVPVAKPDLAGIDVGTFGERVAGEREERLATARLLVPFEQAFLDDALGGVLPGDLILLTARSGEGKTQMASMIAENAARRGRRVLMFALEAERREIERRIKWRVIARQWTECVEPVRKRQRLPALYLSYREWRHGKLTDPDFTALELDFEKHLVASFGERNGERLRTIYRGESFTLGDTQRAMLALQEETDLFIVDHLDYVDLEDDLSENEAARAILARLRHLAVEMRKPVLLIVHVRKDQGPRPPIVPQKEHIHGSSHIVKIATAIISLATAPNDAEWWKSPTYVQVIKDRLDGESRLVGLVSFDRRAGTYAGEYELGRVLRAPNGVERWERLDDERIPPWAHRARRAKQTALPGTEAQASS